MTEFEEQVAHALLVQMGRIRSDEFKLPWNADLPMVPLAARLAPRVAAAIEAAIREAQGTTSTPIEPRVLNLPEDARDAALMTLRGNV